jgi:hypothetical protein
MVAPTLLIQVSKEKNSKLKKGDGHEHKEKNQKRAGKKGWGANLHLV